MTESESPILSLCSLSKRFFARQSLLGRLSGESARFVHALNGINLDIYRGEMLGVMGESGCEKSTLARCLVRLLDPDEGTVLFEGQDIGALKGAKKRAFNRRVQMIFQDPYSSLNPRMTVRQILREALSVHRIRPKDQIDARIYELLDTVRLPRDAADRYPREFSGGQRQRIGIARALSVEPEILIADELVSALDVSVQAQVINLLLQLQNDLNLTIIFVAHDLRLVRHISHRVAVMYLGQLVERRRKNCSPCPSIRMRRHRSTPPRISIPPTASAGPRRAVSFPAPSTFRRAAPSTRAAPSQQKNAARSLPR